MTDKVWKARERQVAKLLGTTRTPLSGGNGKQTRSDTLSKDFYVEAKHRKRHAVLALYDEVAGLADVEGKIPLVVLTEHRRHGAFVIIPLDADVISAVLTAMENVEEEK